MKISERILRALSNNNDSGRTTKSSSAAPSKASLEVFYRDFPDFELLIKDKSIIDFGSGNGYQCLALAKYYHASVTGIEPNDTARNFAVSMLQTSDNENYDVRFFALASPEIEPVDLLISKDSMEHYSEPDKIVEVMLSLLKPGGVLLITFGPPWYAPYGSHMHFFCKVPWLNLLFSEETVMTVRQNFRDDGARRYEDVESGLNRMSLRKFEKILAEQGLEPYFKKYTAIKGLNFLTNLPILRELFTNHVSVLIRRPD